VTNFLLHHLRACVSFGPSTSAPCSLRLSCPVCLIQPATGFIALQNKTPTQAGATGCGISPGGLDAAGQTCSGGRLDLGGGSALAGSSMIHGGSARRAEIPRLRDPGAMCWGSFKARQQGLYKFCRKRPGWVCKSGLTESSLMKKGRWSRRHHGCGRTGTHSHSRQAGNATTAGRDFVSTGAERGGSEAPRLCPSGSCAESCKTGKKWVKQKL